MDVRDRVGRLKPWVYNIFGANYRYMRPYPPTPADNSAGAAKDAYSADHAPLPALDREVLLQLSYLFEPT